MQQVENIIIGAGPGGYELAAELANRGESTVLIERGHPGGTCLNRGCIPTKCLCASASAALQSARAAALGIEVGEMKVDFDKVVARMNDVVGQLRSGVRSTVAKAVYVEGEAVLGENKTVKVGEEVYQASKRLVIATGSSPARLNIPGAELAKSSDDVLTGMTRLPRSVTIIGGGVIGMEFASIFNAFGVETTVVEYCKEILPPFDSDVAKRLRSTLSRRGINIAVSAKVQSVARIDDTTLRVSYEGKRGEVAVDAEMVVMAVGRRPVVPDGASDCGLRISSRGFIEVDELMQTNLAGIYAIGDVNGLSMFAHSAIAQGRVVADGRPEAFRADCVPSVVFTSPEVSMVGPTASVLDARGVDCRVEKRLFAANGKANAMGEAEGFVKMLVGDDDTILGVSIIGPHAADLIAEATILVAERIKLHDVAGRFIHAHPTLSEIFCQ